MVTTAPRLRSSDLPKLLGGARQDVPADIRSVYAGDDADVHLYSRAAWALEAVLAPLREELGRQPRLWVPDYFCDAGLTAVRAAGVELVFYRLTEDLTPDADDLHRMMRDLPSPDALLGVHYFGIPVDLSALATAAKEGGALLIEDAAHCARPTPGIGEIGDAVLYSLYKHLALPDGGMLVDRTGRARDLGGTMAAPGNWALKRSMQTLVPAVAARFQRPPTASFGEDAPAGDAGPPGISALASRLLASAKPEIEALGPRRRALDAALRRAFADASGAGFLTPPPTVDTVPHRTVLRFQGWEPASAFFDAFQKARLAVETWPDLPPEVKAEPDRHAAALDLRQSCLLIPLHDRGDPARFAARYRQAAIG